MSKYRVVTDQGAFEITTEDPAPTLQQAVGPGNEANARNFALASGDPRAVVASTSDPEINANAMPAILGTAGGISPIPGGATMGTAAGQGIRDLMLKGMSKPVPSVGQHALELAPAVLGDAVAIPAMKKAYFGKQIGNAEKAAGVVTNAAEKYPTSGSIGEYLNTLESQIDNGTLRDPNTIKQAKDVIDFVHSNPNIVGKSNAITVQSARIGSKISNLINDASIVPGRAAPAAGMARAMTIPNAIRDTAQTINRATPGWVKMGVGLAGGDALIRALSSAGRK